jgi:hypothetical protein
MTRAVYDEIGVDYTAGRRPDPGWAAAIAAACGDARSLVNVGAGAGSYEPRAMAVTAVEPSNLMLAQRPRAADAVAVARGIARLADDLASGVWTARHSSLLALDAFDAGFRLLVSG